MLHNFEILTKSTNKIIVTSVFSNVTSFLMQCSAIGGVIHLLYNHLITTFAVNLLVAISRSFNSNDIS